MGEGVECGAYWASSAWGCVGYLSCRVLTGVRWVVWAVGHMLVTTLMVVVIVRVFSEVGNETAMGRLTMVGRTYVLMQLVVRLSSLLVRVNRMVLVRNRAWTVWG